MGEAEMNLVVDVDGRGYCWSRYSGKRRECWSGVTERYKKSWAWRRITQITREFGDDEGASRISDLGKR